MTKRKRSSGSLVDAKLLRTVKSTLDSSDLRFDDQ